ncbi:unnamed protein product [Closterium sp. NIES-65]|nr:unnamed protein product [Closterium sp. NIES-65]
MGNGRKGNKAKKGVDMAQETDVPALPLKETAATGKPPLCPAPSTLAGPFEAFQEHADDDAQSTGTPADDDDDGYLSDDSDDHLEPDSLNSIIAVKRFSLTLLVPIARKAEVKRAAFTIAAMLDEWKDLLSPDALLTTTYQDLAPMFLSGERYGRLQVTFNHVKDANFVWNQIIRHECVNGDFVDFTWQHPEDARFQRGRELNPTAKEIIIKGVPAETSAELIRRLLVVSKLVKRGRSTFASGFGFHRTVDPVSGLDTDRIRGLFVPHADDEYRWRTFVEDPTTGKRYLLHYPSLTCDFCGGQHMTRYHDRYVTPKQDHFNNWNVTVKKAGCEKAQGIHFEQASSHIVSARHKEGLRKESSATRVGTFPQKMISFKKELLAVVVRWGGLEFLLIAAYIPAQAVNRSSFYRDSLEPFLQSLPVLHHILVMGDLNVVEDPDLDRTSQAGSSAENHRLLSCWRNTDLRDAFRHIHPDKREYTFFARATRYPHCQRTGRTLLRKEELLEAYERSHKEQLQLWAGIEAEMDGEVASGTLSAQIKTRKAKTTIREVARNGSLFSGVKEVLSAATSHFRDAFGCVSSSAVPATEDHPMQRRLGEASRRALSAPWTEDEVRKAIRELAPRKSPGADGLPKELFDYNWGLLGPVLMDLVRSFTGGEALPHTVSTAVTILLHKKGDKGDLGNYRPITLLSTVCKIIAKVMASRLKVVLHEVISEDQYGFLPGRQLADAVSVVADAIEAGANGKEDWYLMMIDFQKAFDSISRDYLFDTLRELGLPEVFVSWTEGLHKDAGTCLHINGWTGDRVAVEKGVRQGCPLAPYLFLCAVEPPCQEFNRKKLGIGKRGVGTLAYLGYADDTSLLLRGAEQLEAAADVLTVFGRESGLVVNEGKTVVFPLGKNRGKPPPHNLRYKWADKEEPERLLGIWITPNGDPTPS